MIKKEKKLQDKCIAYLDKLDIYYINKYGDGHSAKGCPDLIVCIKGQFVAFELKVDKNDMQDDQKLHRKWILRSGGKHYCPRTIEEFKRIVNGI